MFVGWVEVVWIEVVRVEVVWDEVVSAEIVWVCAINARGSKEKTLADGYAELKDE